MIDPGDIIGGLEARQLAGGVSRATLLRWRADHGFPEPIRTLEGGIELWDRRQVKAWLKESKDWRRKRRRRS